MTPWIAVPIVVILSCSLAALIVWAVTREYRGPVWRVVECPAHEHPFVVEHRTYYPGGFYGWMAVAKGASREDAERYIREKIAEAERRTVAEFDAKGDEVSK